MKSQIRKELASLFMDNIDGVLEVASKPQAVSAALQSPSMKGGLMRLQGKVALITGAGAGIGRAD